MAKRGAVSLGTMMMVLPLTTAGAQGDKGQQGVVVRTGNTNDPNWFIDTDSAAIEGGLL